MNSDVIIKKKNEVYLQLATPAHIAYELSDHFTFEVEGAKFMPAYKQRYWDGKIRLYSPGTGEIYAGLREYIEQFCQERHYTYDYVDNEYFGMPDEEDELISLNGIISFTKKFSKIKARNYQYKAIYEALRKKRKLIVSPTGSGKSFMIYSIVRFLQETGQKILIVVPTTSLVEQMYKDFEDYGWMSEEFCHKVYAGHEKLSPKPVTITTWQSIYKQHRKYFEKFTAVIGDEAHLFKAKSLTDILTKLHHAKYRVGFTGTLDGSKTNKLVLEGLFGPHEKVTNTNELITQGHLSRLKIKILSLKHRHVKFDNYQEEIDYLISHPKRNNFIKNLTLDLAGNTLVLFNYVERHGEPLYELINNGVKGDRKVFFVHGGVDVKDREEIRSITENESDAIIIASYGTFSTGINIKNLHNIVFASPSKSRVRNLQSIGRVLRKGENKNMAILYDIADDTSKDSTNPNYTLKHLFERVKIYNQENFDYEIINIKVKN
jgi:superfamily II DNA or RNA helicase|tara:strand:+ start:272 stop:1741 length:1470 start_codon:yes stop_codon:yes gene_type:complete